MSAPIIDPTEILQSLNGTHDNEKVRILFNLGADLRRVYPGSNDEAFDDLSSALQTMILSCNVQDESTDIGMVLNDLAWASIGYRPFVCRAERKIKSKDGFEITIGLIEAEVESDDFIIGIAEILDVPPWSNRHEVLSQEQVQIMLLTLEKVGLNEANLSDYDVLSFSERFSANVSHIFKIQIVGTKDLEKVIGKEVIDGAEVIGIRTFDSSSLLKEDGSVSMEIFDRMKTQIGLIQAQKELNKF